MKTSSIYYCRTRAWWLISLVGILFILAGVVYWQWPLAGYAIVCKIFGWLLVATGIVQLCVAADTRRVNGRGWWIAGGVIDMLIGFILVRSLFLSEMVLPYFLAFIFLFRGIQSISDATMRAYRYWWLGIINGILLLLIGIFFLEAGWLYDMLMTSFLVSIGFIYWGMIVVVLGYNMRVRKQ